MFQLDHLLNRKQRDKARSKLNLSPNQLWEEGYNQKIFYIFKIVRYNEVKIENSTNSQKKS
jgi:hypothetical protein